MYSDFFDPPDDNVAADTKGVTADMAAEVGDDDSGDEIDEETENDEGDEMQDDDSATDDQDDDDNEQPPVKTAKQSLFDDE